MNFLVIANDVVRINRKSLFLDDTESDEYEGFPDYKGYKQWPRPVKYENELFSVSSIDN
jgi:hypothetical protein